MSAGGYCLQQEKGVRQGLASLKDLKVRSMDQDIAFSEGGVRPAKPRMAGWPLQGSGEGFMGSYKKTTKTVRKSWQSLWALRDEVASQCEPPLG